MRRALIAAVCAVAFLAAAQVANARDAVVVSFDGTPIVAHFYPAPGAGSGQRVPTVLVGPGFAYPGDTNPDANTSDVIGLAALRQAGYNVLTWDPRGFGGSGGTAMFDSPDFEARDVEALIDYVARQPEAELDAPGDPRVGMSGSSYGGGIQLTTAALDPRLDAIIPDIAWHSLPDALFRDGDPKVLVNTALCGLGAADGLLDGLLSPAGPQTGSIDGHILTACATGVALGSISADDIQWYADRGPGPLVDRIRTPTFLIQGTVDTLLPPGQAIANYEILRANGVPVKMLWRCGGHGTCFTGDDPEYVRQAGLRWLARWLKRDTSVDTGPAFEWRTDDATWRAGPDYPLAPAGQLSASGSGQLTFTAVTDATGSGAPAYALPALRSIEVPFPAPPDNSDLVGDPTVTMTYSGHATPAHTYVYAQILDVGHDRVVDNQVIPLPVDLDGAEHQVSRDLEAISIRGHASSQYRLQITPSTTVYARQQSTGQITAERIAATMPIVDATRSGRPQAASRRKASKSFGVALSAHRLRAGDFAVRVRSVLRSRPCSGTVAFRIRFARSVRTSVATVSHGCVAQATLRLSATRGTLVSVSAHYSGNASVRPGDARILRQRLR